MAVLRAEIGLQDQLLGSPKPVPLDLLPNAYRSDVTDHLATIEKLLWRHCIEGSHSSRHGPESLTPSGQTRKFPGQTSIGRRSHDLECSSSPARVAVNPLSQPAAAMVTSDQQPDPRAWRPGRESNPLHPHSQGEPGIVHSQGEPGIVRRGPRGCFCGSRRPRRAGCRPRGPLNRWPPRQALGYPR